MSDLLSTYHALPYSLKVLAASLRGMQLNSMRYGHDTDALAEAALQREHWNANQWQDWQGERLSSMLTYAAASVPYYREAWAARRRRGDHSSVERLENWPILHKEDLRSYPDAFIADGFTRKHLISDHTSGSSGMPLALWLDLKAVRGWYALFEARWRKWYGLSRHDRWGMLGGQLIARFSQSTPPFWVWNAGMKQLYLSTFHISPQFIPAYFDAIRQHRLVYLLGFASSLYDVARFAIEQHLAAPPLKAVLSNAEALRPHQRDAIARAFSCRVIDTYGQAEFVCAASECSAGHMHLWPEVGVTEVLSDRSDEPTAEGQAGRLISTGLLNRAMPLVRYEIGDRASFAPPESVCTCGRTLPMLGGIEGRTEDVIVTPDGRCIEPDTVFQSAFPIHEAQIIQETLDRIRICVVPAPGFSARTAELLISRLRDRVGSMDIVVDEVSSIPRATSGKRKVIVSMINNG